MREEREIREAVKDLNDDRLRKRREPLSYCPQWSVAMITTLEWALGDGERLPYFPGELAEVD